MKGLDKGFGRIPMAREGHWAGCSCLPHWQHCVDPRNENLGRLMYNKKFTNPDRTEGSCPTYGNDCDVIPKVIIHNVYRVDEDYKNAMVYFCNEDDIIVGSVPMKHGGGYTLDDSEPRFSCEPQQPGPARTNCCEGMLYYARCINCLRWYTFDVLKELYEEEKLEKMVTRPATPPKFNDDKSYMDGAAYLTDPDKWVISPYALGDKKNRAPATTTFALQAEAANRVEQEMAKTVEQMPQADIKKILDKSPIESLQEAMKEAMDFKTGGAGCDDPTPCDTPAKATCSCEITGQGRIPNISCQLTEKEHYG